MQNPTHRHSVVCRPLCVVSKIAVGYDVPKFMIPCDSTAVACFRGEFEPRRRRLSFHRCFSVFCERYVNKKVVSLLRYSMKQKEEFAEYESLPGEGSKNRGSQNINYYTVKEQKAGFTEYKLLPDKGSKGQNTQNMNHYPVKEGNGRVHRTRIANRWRKQKVWFKEREPLPSERSKRQGSQNVNP